MDDIRTAKELVSFPAMLQSIVNRSCIIDYGIVKEVVSRGIVTVEMSVANSVDDIRIITCVLANIASDTLTLELVPEEGDKVLVLYPRLFDSEMFNKNKEEAIIKTEATGYNIFSGIAFLYNQYKSSTHFNFIQSNKGQLAVKLAYDQESKKNNIVLNVDGKGALTLNLLNVDDSYLVNFSINEDGELHYDSNENVNLDINKDGELHYDSNENVNLDINKDGELHYDSNENVNLDINKDGELSLDSNGKYKLDINKDGELSLDSNGKYQLTINKDGELESKAGNISIKQTKSAELTVDTGKATVSIDSSGNVTIDAKTGKISLKNSIGSLYDILDGMLQTLNTSLATAGSPASHTVIPQQFAQQSLMLGQVMK